MIGTAAAMGFTPRELDGMTLYEFSAAAEGWARANGVGDDKATAPTDDEDEALRARYRDV